MKPKFLLIVLFPAVAAIVLGGCKGGNYEEAKTESADSAYTAKVDTSSNVSKLVKTGDINFKVKNVQQTSENISALVVKDNGMVMHDDLTSTVQQTRDVALNNDSVMRVSAFNTTGDMTVKIPTEKIEDFLNTVSHMGIYVNEKKMDIEDKSLDYLASQLKLNNRRELVSQQKTGKVIIKDPNAVLNLKDDMVDEQINNRQIDDEVKYSVISLSFFQSNTISKEIVVNDDTSTYHLPFFAQLSIALANGWYLFSQVLIGIINLWALIVCAVFVWVLVRWYQKKRARQPLV